MPKHQIPIDSNAHALLNRIKKEMHDKGIETANYSEAIRYLHSLRSDPQ